MHTDKGRDEVGTQPASYRERAWIFCLLIAPLAVLANGVNGGALSFLFRSQGVGPARSAEILALLALPQTIYFLWSPVTDFLMCRRTWLMVAATASAIGVLLAFHRHNLAGPVAVGLMFGSACLGQLIVASCGGMMGTLHSEITRRRASSFYQGGSLAFGALAVMVLVLLAGRMSLGAMGWIVAAMIALPALAALLAPEQSAVGEHSVGETVRQIWREFKATFLHWGAIPYTLTMLFPMCSGAMIALLPGLAVDYHVSAQQVAWINGLGGALLMAAGAMAASLIPATVRAPVAYLLSSLVNAATLAILWLGPLQPAVYFTSTILFLFTIGAGYALFTAVVLEFLGGSGKSGSARYSIINSMGNVPVAYMTYLDGRSYDHWGARGLPATDVVLSVAGASLLLLYFLTRGRRRNPELTAG